MIKEYKRTYSYTIINQEMYKDLIEYISGFDKQHVFFASELLPIAAAPCTRLDKTDGLGANKMIISKYWGTVPFYDTKEETVKYIKTQWVPLHEKECMQLIKELDFVDRVLVDGEIKFDMTKLSSRKFDSLNKSRIDYTLIRIDPLAKPEPESEESAREREEILEALRTLKKERPISETKTLKTEEFVLTKNDIEYIKSNVNKIITQNEDYFLCSENAVSDVIEELAEKGDITYDSLVSSKNSQYEEKKSAVIQFLKKKYVKSYLYYYVCSDQRNIRYIDSNENVQVLRKGDDKSELLVAIEKGSYSIDDSEEYYDKWIESEDCCFGEDSKCTIEVCYNGKYYTIAYRCAKPNIG